MCKSTGPAHLGMPAVRTASAGLEEHGAAAFSRLRRF
jgi:hypothetical protein